MTPLVEQAEPAQHFVFHGASWAYYEQTLAAIGNRRIPVAYLDGEMGIGRPKQAEPAQHFVFYDVPWAFYEETTKRACFAIFANGYSPCRIRQATNNYSPSAEK